MPQKPQQNWRNCTFMNSASGMWEVGDRTCEYTVPGRKGHLLCLPPVHTALAVKQVFILRNSAHRHPSLGAKLSGFWPRAPPALSVLTSSMGSLIGDSWVISCVLVVRPTGRVCVVQGWGVLQGRPLPVVPTLLIFSPVSLNVSIHRERYDWSPIVSLLTFTKLR